MLGGRKRGWLFLVPQTGPWGRLSEEDPWGPGTHVSRCSEHSFFEETEAS